MPHRLDVDLTAGHPAGESRLKSPVSGSQLAPWLSRDARLFSFGGELTEIHDACFRTRSFVPYEIRAACTFSSPCNVNINEEGRISPSLLVISVAALLPLILYLPAPFRYSSSVVVHLLNSQYDVFSALLFRKMFLAPSCLSLDRFVTTDGIKPNVYLRIRVNHLTS